MLIIIAIKLPDSKSDLAKLKFLKRSKQSPSRIMTFLGNAFNQIESAIDFVLRPNIGQRVSDQREFALY